MMKTTLKSTLHTGKNNYYTNEYGKGVFSHDHEKENDEIGNTEEIVTNFVADNLHRITACYSANKTRLNSST